MNSENPFHPRSERTWYDSAPPYPETKVAFREPDAIPYAATPLEPFTERQQQVGVELQKLFEHPYPNDTPATFVELVKLDYMRNRAQRETKNHDHFVNFLAQNPDISSSSSAIIEKTADGTATPAELLSLLSQTQLGATEIAKMSVPYGYRLDKLAQMRDDIREAIKTLGGEYANDTPYEHIHVQPCLDDRTWQRLDGILTTYQRKIGEFVGDDNQPITVMERQSLGIRIDEASGFDQYIAEKLQAQYTSGDPVRIEAANKRIIDFVQHQTPEKFLVPLSVTCFAYREGAERTQYPASTGELAQVAFQSLMADL